MTNQHEPDVSRAARVGKNGGAPAGLPDARPDPQSKPSVLRLRGSAGRAEVCVLVARPDDGAMTDDPADLKRAKRIVILSRSNGVSGASLGAIAVILSLMAGDSIATFASLGICAAAALEITGSFRAARRDRHAPRFLVASQAVSLLSLLALLVRCTIALNPSTLLEWMPQSYAEMIQVLYPGPGEAAEFLRVGVRSMLGLIALVAALFEAGMATYYASSAGLFLRLSSAGRNRP